MIKPAKSINVKFLFLDSYNLLYNTMPPYNIIVFYFNPLIELIRSKIYRAINFDSK
jgi:hypothetical protein